MALIQSTAIPSGATDYELEQSLKFEDGDSATLSWTPASAGNRTTWTFSCWVKRGNLGGPKTIFGANNNSQIHFDGNDKMYLWVSGSSYYIPSRVFRDTSSWYNIILVWNTTATSADRIMFYVNGVRLTDFSSGSTPAANATTEINNNVAHYCGDYGGDEFFDGYLAEVNFLDGVVGTPADFGKTGTYGEWKPIEYSGTYGTNGFYLPFKQDYTVEGFSTVVYRGNGGTQYIGGTGFQPDLTWIKNRDTTDWNQLTDSVRGTSSQIFSNDNSAQDTATDKITSFDPDGFSLDSHESVNTNNEKYVAWNWDMGGSNATNSNGSITSTVRANTTYGQSIVSYTGTQSNDTVGHGLSSAPEMILVKNRTNATQWIVLHKGIASDYETDYVALNTTAAAADDIRIWNDTKPTASLFTVGIENDVNKLNSSYIAYCFHSVTGYSKFGSYTGNGSSTGPSVTLGFAPAFLMIKRTDSSQGWNIWDNVRDNTNPNNTILEAHDSPAEVSHPNYNIDFTTTGFQIKSTYAGTNTSGGTYIYMAFADKREYAYWLDQSGNNNDFTSNNLTESDVMVDSPSNNFATLNPLVNVPNIQYEEGNLKSSNTAADEHKTVYGTMAISSGKWYWEACATSGVKLTMALTDTNNVDDQQSATVNFIPGYIPSSNYANGDAVSVYYNSTRKNGSVVTADIFPSYISSGEIISMAFDADTGKVWFAMDGVWTNGSAASSTTLNTSYPDTTVSTTANSYTPAWATEASAWVVNFGQDSSFASNKTAQGNQDGNDIGDFYYTPPTGFLALCTKNLPDVAVTPSEHFNTVLYTGNGATGQTITVGFQPDFTWIKQRSGADYHALQNSVTGNNKILTTNGTFVEWTIADALTAWTSTGFTLGADTSGFVNENSATYAAWNWKANGSGSSNTDGSINTTATSANVDAGFSISTYTGTGVNGTIGHGLSKAPEMVIVKERGDDTGNWYVWHTGFAATDGIFLNLTNAKATSDTYWNDTAPTADVFSVGTNTDINGNTGTDTYVAYCFHSVDGYSKVGSYTGNGNADGTFVYTGFRPAFIMAKKTDAAENWVMINNKTHPYNDVNTPRLYPNLSNSEYEDGSIYVDYVSNGFKIRATQNMMNNNGSNYIYIAFASVPFKFGNAR